MRLDDLRRSPCQWFLLAVMLAAIVACAPSVATEAPSATPASPSDAPSPRPSATPPVADPELLMTRFGDGLRREVSLVGDLVASVEEADLEPVRAATEAISDWTNDERAWLNAQTIPGCLADAADAYGLGLRDLGLGAVSLSILMIGTASPDELEAAVQRMLTGGEEISNAVHLAAAAVCNGVSAPEPTLSGALDLKAAYSALAAATNQDATDLAADTSLDTRGRVERLLDIERSALATMSSWPDPSGKFDELEASMGVVVSLLRDAKASASDDGVGSGLLVAALAMNEEGLVDTTSQREAAAQVRERLGLPPLGQGDAL